VITTSFELRSSKQSSSSVRPRKGRSAVARTEADSMIAAGALESRAWRWRARHLSNTPAIRSLRLEPGAAWQTGLDHGSILGAAIRIPDDRVMAGTGHAALSRPESLSAKHAADIHAHVMDDRAADRSIIRSQRCPVQPFWDSPRWSASLRQEPLEPSSFSKRPSGMTSPWCSVRYWRMSSSVGSCSRPCW
jgi:hypothetical protein